MRSASNLMKTGVKYEGTKDSQERNAEEELESRAS